LYLKEKEDKIIVGNDIDITMDGWIHNAFPTTFKYHSLNPKPFSLYPSQINKRRRKIIR
jgi:hypothetical protein